MIECLVLGPNKFGTKGSKLYDWLLSQDDTQVSGIVTDKSQYRTIRKLKPDLLISAGFSHIVPEDVLNLPELGAVNLHPSYLPYNRGTDPSQWSIIRDNPVGVSVHYMSPEVDLGPIISRRKVPVYPDDNARDLFHRLEREQVDLFKEVWPSIKDGTASTVEQGEDEGTYNHSTDFDEIAELDLQEEMTMEKIIDRLRALTFPPYKNAYFEKQGERYYVEIEITPESEVEEIVGFDWPYPRYPEPKME